MHNAKKALRAGCECKDFICNVLRPYSSNFRMHFMHFYAWPRITTVAADDADITDANGRGGRVVNCE